MAEVVLCAALADVGASAIKAGGEEAIEATRAVLHSGRLNLAGPLANGDYSIIVDITIANASPHPIRVINMEYYSGEGKRANAVEPAKTATFCTHNKPGSWYGSAGTFQIKIGGATFTVLWSGSNAASDHGTKVVYGASNYAGMGGDDIQGNGHFDSEATGGGFTVDTAIDNERDRATMTVIVALS